VSIVIESAVSFKELEKEIFKINIIIYKNETGGLHG
jgi:hypothetical protein